MTPKSVKKKMKTPAFAAAVNRDEMRQAAEELGVDFDQHVARVIAAMEERAGELGLEGEGAAASGEGAERKLVEVIGEPEGEIFRTSAATSDDTEVPAVTCSIEHVADDGGGVFAIGVHDESGVESA